MIPYYLFPSMIFPKEDIKIEMIATSPPQGRIVKIVNVYTSCPLLSALELLCETAIALVQVTELSASAHRQVLAGKLDIRLCLTN